MYDPLTVGKYCEKRDPNLATIAYTKGQNDLELISITNENGMFRQQARYLLERADPEIWTYVLNPDNVHRRSLLDQVTATAVPEAVSCSFLVSFLFLYFLFPPSTSIVWTPSNFSFLLLFFSTSCLFC